MYPAPVVPRRIGCRCYCVGLFTRGKLCRVNLDDPRVRYLFAHQPHHGRPNDNHRAYDHHAFTQRDRSRRPCRPYPLHDRAL